MPSEKLPEMLDTVTDAYKQGVDRTLIRENLKLSPEQRILRLIELQKFAEELKAAGIKARSRSR